MFNFRGDGNLWPEAYRFYGIFFVPILIFLVHNNFIEFHPNR